MRSEPPKTITQAKQTSSEDKLKHKDRASIYLLLQSGVGDHRGLLLLLWLDDVAGGSSSLAGIDRGRRRRSSRGSTALRLAGTDDLQRIKGDQGTRKRVLNFQNTIAPSIQGSHTRLRLSLMQKRHALSALGC